MIQELIGVRLWRDKVFTLLLEDAVKREKPKSTFPCYIVVSYQLVIHDMNNHVRETLKDFNIVL